MPEKAPNGQPLKKEDSPSLRRGGAHNPHSGGLKSLGGGGFHTAETDGNEQSESVEFQNAYQQRTTIQAPHSAQPYNPIEFHSDPDDSQYEWMN